MQLARRGNLVAADAMLVNAAAMSPDDSRIDLARAHVSSARKDPVSVLLAANRILTRTPDHPEASFLKAHALYSLGRLSEAVEFIDALEADAPPDLSHNLLGLRVKALMRDGDSEEIRSGLEQLEASEGKTPRLEKLRIELEQRSGDHAAALAGCETLLDRTDLPPSDRAEIGLQRARLLDRAARHADAAEAATIANDILAPPFDPDTWRDAMTRSCDYFTPQRLQELPRPARGLGEHSARPVFIIGMPRSGTSLLEQIIASHPEAGGVGERLEPLLIDQDLSHLLQAPSPRWLEQASPPLLDRAAERYDSMIDLVGAPGARVTNKALGLEPVVGMLATMLPESRFIWIHRSAEDNRLSIWMHQILLPWTWRLSDIDGVRSFHDHAREHWSRTLPERTLVVSYEHLVQEPTTEISRVLDFLELKHSTACLEFHRSQRAVMTPSASQVREPMHDRAVGRARAYRDLLTQG